MRGGIQPYTYPLILLGLIALFVLTYAQIAGPPKVVSAANAGTGFSAERAFAELEDLLAENVPHPTGSKANNRIRSRIIAKLTALGLNVKTQNGLSCATKFAGCAEAQNIIAIKKGTGKAGGKAILLATHYDSVPAGAGAGDDGAGVAASLEIARILNERQQLANDVIFLITDAEETGLLGAKLFADQHRLMGQVGLVINLEARGVTGNSSMFETGPDNRKLIKVFGQSTKHPAANSLSFEIYQRMPNDTDYSIYKEAGAQGLNFAFAGGASLYHSAGDDLAHLDQRSLQHHGDNALGLINAFGDRDLNDLKAKGNATYFDVFSAKLIAWPSSWNIPMAALVFLFLTIIMVRQLKFSAKAMVFAVLAVFGLFVLPIAAGWVLSFPLGKWTQMHPLDHPFPWPGRIALLGASVLVAVLVGKVSSRLVSAKALLLGAYWLMSCLALVFGFALSGGTYLMLVPAILFAIGLIFDLLRKRQHLTMAAHLGFLGALYMAVYHFFLLDLVANFPMSFAKMIPLNLISLSLAPLLQHHWNAKQMRWRFALVPVLGFVAIFTAIGAMVPGFDESHPRGQNLVLIEHADTGKAEWVSEAIGGNDLPFLQAAGFPAEKESYNKYGLYERKRFVKPASPRHLSAPQFSLISDESEGEIRTIIAEIQTTRQATALAVGFLASELPLSLSIEGQMTAQYDTPGNRTGRMVLIHGPRDKPYRIEIKTKVPGKFSFVVLDDKRLAPKETEGMADKRPENSKPAFRGDRSVVVVPVVVGSD
jgi:hypothetical protein